MLQRLTNPDVIWNVVLSIISSLGMGMHKTEKFTR